MTARSRHKPAYSSNLTDLMIFKNRWWQHLLFWTAALLVLFNIFKSSGSVEKIDIIGEYLPLNMNDIVQVFKFFQE